MRLDVVVVPDFEGSSRLVFEYNTNLFLASWLEHESNLSDSQLHLVCVGEPPPTTRRLAEQANCKLTVCESVSGPDRFRNKLRGLQVTPSSDYFILLDTDIVLFQTIDRVAHLLDLSSMGLSYSSGTHLSIAQWTDLYDRLGMKPPTIRVALDNAAFSGNFLDHPYYEEFSATVPYYNSGVVAAPWNFGLRHYWERLIDQVPWLLQNDKHIDKPIFRHALYDQPPLAIAAEMLRREGRKLSVLPHALHARWQHFCLGLVSPDDVLIAHNTGIFKREAPADVPSGIRQYATLTKNRMQDREPSELQENRLIKHAHHLEEYLLMLYEKWIVRVQD